MARLYFKAIFHEAVRSGRKTSTLRRWSRPMVSSGQTVLSPHVGKLTIADCRPIELKNLTAADAQADGFASVAELMETIERIYPNQDGDGKCWYRVQFVLARKAPTRPRPPMGPRAAKRRLARVIRDELAAAVFFARRG